MQSTESIRVGKWGTVVIPAVLRRAYRLEEGSLLVAEAREEGILFRPAAVYPVEVYTPSGRSSLS